MFSVTNYVNVYSAILGAIALLWYVNRSVYSYWRKLNIKCVSPVPILGNAAKATLQLSPIQEEYDKLYKGLLDEPFAGIYQLFKPQLFLKDPQLVSTILGKDFNHFYNRGFRGVVNENKKVDPLASNLVFTNGERWRLVRQKLSPVFTSGKLKLMHDQIMNCVATMTQYVDNRMQAGEVDLGMKELFEKLTTDVIGGCAFGIECNSFESSASEFGEMGRLAFKPRLRSVARLIVAPFSKRLADFLCPTFLRPKVHNFYLNLTLDTVDYRRRNGVTRNDLLQLLMELQNCHVDPRFAVGNKDKVPENEEFDELDVAANSFIIFTAGFETTASTLSFCLYELALNQDVQEKLRSEVKEIRDGSQRLTYEMFREMNYMDAVINETLRKYPPIPFLTRECTEDYVIPGTKTRIPAGVEVIIPTWSIQHDCKYYSNPEVFDPERFVGDNKHSQASGVFLPFGDGPRYCLGKRFANMEIKATLSEMILKYDIKTCAKTEIPLKFRKGNGLIQTTCGTWVRLSKRKC